MSKYKWKKNLICFGGAIGIATSPLTIYHSINFFNKGNSNHNIKRDSTSYFHNTGIDRSLPIISLLQDNDGNMWIGTIDKGLYKYDTNNILTPIDNGISANLTITRIIQDKAGNIWVGSRMNGLYKKLQILIPLF